MHVVVRAETRTDSPGDVGFRDRPFNFNSDFSLAVIIYYRPSTRPTLLIPDEPATSRIAL